jgi:hypothetical protein
MGLIFKLIGILTTIATTVVVIGKSAEHGLILFSTLIGLIRILIFLAFCGLLAYIAYLLIRSNRQPASSD